MLKTRRFGYDGKGQAIIRSSDDPDQVWQDLGTKSAILEAFVPFEREISVIAARSADGQVECFDVTENEHRDHILKVSRAPAAIPETLAAQARDVAQRIATALNYVGVLAVEMFVVQGDGGPKVLVNEIAPRVHNSGHWTLDGASISQFEQHIRAIAGWPLGKPVRHGPVTMTNLIGDEINSYEQWLTVPGATVHLYGKGPPRPGRKMGHVTQVHTQVHTQVQRYSSPRNRARHAGKNRLIGTLRRDLAGFSTAICVSDGGHSHLCLIHPRAQGRELGLLPAL